VVAIVKTAALIGVDAQLIDVEAELSMGLPYFSVIGLGDTSVQEARYRIQASLRAASIELPHKRITINLAPAAIRKDGASLDVPMALSVLVEAGVLDVARLERSMAIGELALTGAIRPVRGTLSIASLAKSLGYEQVVVPKDNAQEALAVEGIRVVAPATLGELVTHLRGEAQIPQPPPPPPRPPAEVLDLRDVRGQRIARRAIEIAAAGGHNLLFIGNPGAGKTMLARRLPGILPPLSPQESIEVTRAWSAAGLTLGADGLVTDPPFRAPHHSISEAALVGGGSHIRPGEVSLAHRGVLFLDEMPEIPRRVLESLRQPLEDRHVVISRARHTVRLPASFILVASANPCPCGWFGHRSRRCTCRDDEVKKYLGKISGPLLDRIDMVIETPSLTSEEIMSEEETESSEIVRARVVEARAIAQARSGTINAELFGERLRKNAKLDEAGKKLLRLSLERLDLSARGAERALRVARTIADLRGDERVSLEAIAEALRYRPPAGWMTKLAA
jgi:magnesium chelatase family protein